MLKALRRAWLRGILLVGLVSITTIATAYDVGPMRITLQPSSGQVTGTIHVNNDRDVPLPIEIKTFRRVIAEDGSQKFDPVDGAFIVFPPQIQVPAKSSQAIRFQYVGDPAITDAQAYVLQVTEVPVTQPGFSGVHFTYNFGVAVYVDPANAADRLTVESVDRENGGLRVKVRNDGNAYSTLSRKTLTLTSADSKTTLLSADVGARIDNPLVPPHFTRVVDIKNTTMPGTSQISAVFQDVKG